MFDLISLVIAPLFVGLVLLLVEHWLDDQRITTQVVVNLHVYCRSRRKKSHSLSSQSGSGFCAVCTDLISYRKAIITWNIIVINSPTKSLHLFPASIFLHDIRTGLPFVGYFAQADDMGQVFLVFFGKHDRIQDIQQINDGKVDREVADL